MVEAVYKLEDMKYMFTTENFFMIHRVKLWRSLVILMGILFFRFLRNLRHFHSMRIMIDFMHEVFLDCFNGSNITF